MSAPPQHGTHPPTAQLVRFVRENPVTVGVLALGILGGAVAGALLPFVAPEKPAFLRAIGGAILGGCVAMFPLGYRLFDR